MDEDMDYGLYQLYDDEDHENQDKKDEWIEDEIIPLYQGIRDYGIGPLSWFRIKDDRKFGPWLLDRSPNDCKEKYYADLLGIHEASKTAERTAHSWDLSHFAQSSCIDEEFYEKNVDKERVDDEFQLPGDQPSWKELWMTDNSRSIRSVAKKIAIRYAADGDSAARESSIRVLAKCLKALKFREPMADDVSKAFHRLKDEKALLDASVRKFEIKIHQH
jgi:hypothetical protein